MVKQVFFIIDFHAFGNIYPLRARHTVSACGTVDFQGISPEDIKSNLISFDHVVHAMNYTGNKLAIELKETSLGGLSLEYHE